MRTATRREHHHERDGHGDAGVEGGPSEERAHHLGRTLDEDAGHRGERPQTGAQRMTGVCGREEVVEQGQVARTAGHLLDHRRHPHHDQEDETARHQHRPGSIGAAATSAGPEGLARPVTHRGHQPDGSGQR